MTGRIICAFPGQGSQFVGMGKNLYDQDPDVQTLYQEANDALGYDLQRLCFAGPEEQLRLTEHTQPAILVHSVAAWTVLRKRGMQPLLLAGHSLGEYSALVAAGVLAFADAVCLVHKARCLYAGGCLLVKAVHAMLRCRARRSRPMPGIRAAEVLQPANHNAPGQIVIAGDTACVHAAPVLSRSATLDARLLLNVSAPFHCQLLQPAAVQLATAFADVPVGHFTLPVIANISAAPYPSAEVVKDFLIRQVCAPVRWEESMQYAVAQGGTEFLEVGPGKVLSTMMRRIAARSRSWISTRCWRHSKVGRTAR
jgi:[acyl-carrier-protein] S-malonyltransferase